MAEMRSFSFASGLRISVLLLAFSTIYSTCSAELLPQDFSFSDRTEALIDAGWLWSANSAFHPLRISDDSLTTSQNNYGAFGWVHGYLFNHVSRLCKLKENSTGSMSVLFEPGLVLRVQTGAARQYKQLAWQPLIWTEARFRRNWFARVYIRMTNESRSLPHFTGIQRDIDRAGITAAEIDQASFGYRNDWAHIEYGRSREIQGTSGEDNLVLAGSAPAWDRLLLEARYHRFTYRYFFGFLESIRLENHVQRYIAGRSLEYRNRSNLVLGVSELSIQAGENRPIDLAHLNPLGLHVEIEQNRRGNQLTSNLANAIWILYLDWRPMKRLRVSGSLALDEFQLDQQDREEGRTDAIAYSARIAWTPLIEPVGLTAFIDRIMIGTYTMQHTYPYCNFVSRGELLGHPIGNDAEKTSVGFRLVFRQPVLLQVEYGLHRWGANSLLYDPYESFTEFIKVKFPSGEVRTNRFLALKIDAQPFGNWSLGLFGKADLSHSGQGSAMETWTFSMRYLLPIMWLNI